MTIDCVSYLRVSGESQILTDGFPRQREACQSFASANGYEIVQEFRDEGVTGKMELEGREGLSACLAFIRENKITVAIIEDSTRLARDMIVSEVIIREFQKVGVRVISASGGVDLTAGDDSNPTAKLIRQILAAVSEFERCCINLKLRGARQRKKAETGRCEGIAPFGSKPGEQPILAAMLDRRKQGYTCEQIAGFLNTERIPSRSGGPWGRATVAKIVKRLNASTTPQTTN